MFKKWIIKYLTITTVIILSRTLLSVTAQSNPYSHIHNLDNEGSYVLEWLVNWANRSITFKVTVATTGYIGLGLSQRGGKTGTDFIVGGVDARGQPYLIDMHGSSLDENTPVQDESQDYILHNGWENGTHTFLQFSRQLETCDNRDYAIDDNTVMLLWCYGENDDYSHYHYRNRGTSRVHLLDPDWTPREFQEAIRAKRVGNTRELANHDLNVWTLTRTQRIPATDTVYWCSFHKGPQLEKRHHLVGFNFRWEQDIEYNRTHHMLLFRCQAPDGEDPVEFFEPYVQNNTGEMCFFFMRGQSGGLPLQYCRELVYAYAIGAKMFFLPEHAGIPFGDAANEYYALQVHYDNYDRRADIEYTINIDLYYTGRLRENEAGIATTGHNIPGTPSILVPPGSREHTIHGHCGSECTKIMLPPEGIHILGVQQHTHLSGRHHRLQHFRKDKEMPWIVNDDNYDGNFQAIRMQRRETHIVPGDQILTRCVYDNTWTNGAVVGGFSTRQEMCLVYFWYYNKMPNHLLCRSEIMEQEEFAEKHLGVRNFTWSDEFLEPLVTDPVEFAGLTISQVADNHVEWSSLKRRELQQDHTFLPQMNSCPSLSQLRNGNGEGDGAVVQYPLGAQEYAPENTFNRCTRNLNRNGYGNYPWGSGGVNREETLRDFKGWKRQRNFWKHH